MATSDDLKDALKAIEPILELSQTLASEAEARAAAQRPPRRPSISEWDDHDPLRTERAKMMCWHFETTGVLGVAQYVVDIAQYEANDEARKSPSLGSDVSSQQQQVTAPSGTQASGVQTATGSPDPLRDTIIGSSEASDHAPDSANAPETPRYDKSWDLILNDSKYNGGRKIIYYLSSIPAELLRALISGNLPSQMEDKRFRRKVEPYVTPVDRQGTYGIWVAIARVPAQSTQQDSDVNRYAGMGLTMRQLERVHDTMRAYIDFANPQSADLAKSIDASFTGGEKRRSSWDYSYQRRYGSGSDNHEFGHHLQWLNFIDSHYLQWARAKAGTSEEPVLNIPMQRCFAYVGLSNSVVSRMTNHWKHSEHINRTLGLLTATLEYLYPSIFTVTKSSYQIFKTISKEDIGFDEKLSMILTGAYPWDGGLNAAYGGRSRGSGPTDLSSTSLRKLQMSADEIEASGLVQLNLDDSLRKLAEHKAQVAEVTRKRKVQHEAQLATCETESVTKSLVQKVKAFKASCELASKSTQ